LSKNGYNRNKFIDAFGEFMIKRGVDINDIVYLGEKTGLEKDLLKLFPYGATGENFINYDYPNMSPTYSKLELSAKKNNIDILDITWL
jgi:hypothetical protein